MECKTCKSNNGIERISPAESIFIGKFWRVEHAYPTGLLGWLVLVLNRHTEALHDLTKDEWAEFSELHYSIVQLLHKEFKTQKEYSCCFAEVEGFAHIHFHIIPKDSNYDAAASGTKAFQYLSTSEPVSKQSVRDFCDRVRTQYFEI